jgi:hypothetical protein
VNIPVRSYQHPAVQALVTAIGERTNHKTLSFSGKNQDGACLRSATYFGDRSVKHSFETTSRRKEQQAWQIHGKVAGGRIKDACVACKTGGTTRSKEMIV